MVEVKCLNPNQGKGGGSTPLNMCLRKNVISPSKINIFKKFNQQQYGETVAILLLFDFFQNIDFQRRYNNLSETHI